MPNTQVAMMMRSKESLEPHETAITPQQSSRRECAGGGHYFRAPEAQGRQACGRMVGAGGSSGSRGGMGVGGGGTGGGGGVGVLITPAHL